MTAILSTAAGVMLLALCASGQLTGQKIKNWQAEINFHANVEDMPRMLKEPEKPNRIHDFLKTFTFSHDRYSQQFEEHSASTLDHDGVVNQAPVLAYISQDFDHFNLEGGRYNGRKYAQYFYYTNEQNATSPTRNLNFLLLEGEGGFTQRSISPRLFMVNTAKKLGATAWSLEHRFYSNNALLNSVNPNRLKLLSSEQALADAAVFIANINEQRNLTNPKWIVFGGSYPGNLAAWLRLKYPKLVHAAIASSAPVETKTHFYEYMQVVEDSFHRYGGEKCAKNIENFFALAGKMIQNEEGRRKLGVCDKHGDVKHFGKYDLELFFSSHLGRLSSAVQYDDLEHQAVNRTCDYYKNELARLESLLNKDVKALEVSEGPCQQFSFEYDMEYFSRYKTLTYYWYWQTCTELGYFQSSQKPYSSYSVWQDSLPVDFFVEMCTVMFGPDYNRTSVDAAVERNHEIYGGKEGYNATNVLFFNGSEDPWHVLSVLNDRVMDDGGAIRSVLIEGTSHCKDMYVLAEGQQHDGMTNAHSIALELLKKWVKE